MGARSASGVFFLNYCLLLVFVSWLLFPRITDTFLKRTYLPWALLFCWPLELRPCHKMEISGTD